MAHAQMLVGITGARVAAGVSCSPFTDTFSGTGALSANWTDISAAINGGHTGYTVVQASGVAQESLGNGYRAAAIITACTPSATAPYVQWTISTTAGASNAQGAVLLMSALGTGYHLDLITGATAVTWYKCNTGCSSQGTFGACTAWAAGQVIKISAVVTTSVVFTVSQNGTPCGTVTDSSSPYLTGYDGVQIQNGNTGTINQKMGTFSAN